MSEKEKEQVREELPERWSAQRKMDVVVRLLRGEDLGELSREVQVRASELENWRRVFLEGGVNGLKPPHDDKRSVALPRDACAVITGGQPRSLQVSMPI